ncbi:TPA: hypothetical protein DDW69_04590 [candidate division CPR2 bacterium]|uniref:Uncharacterized protein n=1 Tax=candidate division CPR2 bacterium GW2011_GWC1_41_48 TaxID=1618344 RepID=A0A0G0WB76_UNCC2|nr:MAG: hypothetical protein UT47_C0002G0204 [candidate division CPR2 bacterium GW2011_GWC2_39_35]KKR29061.1 MAG: hypothetical protein UT60_C0007G0006 [candidate division CPR2 bacterium GW2011_GWD2_39_7]KKS09322.1 MAG: hypothetical protein UU65_C0002G0100 [candidate division CPR2 bacterium GW2011_GWC1_41_48]OGB70549.1 MAG: hypothetical protein A2Y26_04380 [candidate division CPR2 bacterium GWD2_39_7]HBG82078.1 hypothetical protein [candidate division CPR2 bacterium]
MKTKGDSKQTILAAILIIVIGGSAFFFYSLNKGKKTSGVKAKPLPFTGKYDVEGFNKFLMIKENEERPFYAVVPPDPAQSICRNIFTGKKRDFSAEEKAICEGVGEEKKN